MQEGQPLTHPHKNGEATFREELKATHSLADSN